MITIVTGFPRSGSSLMMRMLHRGGIPMYGNDISGEHDDVLKLQGGDFSWMPNVDGKCVKILDPHIYQPPRPELIKNEYQTVWMHRNPREQARSQIKLLKTLGFPADNTAIPRIANSLRKDYLPVSTFIRKLSARYVEVNFEDAISRPDWVVERLCEMLQGIESPSMMTEEIIERGPECLPYMLEIEQILGK
jgi:hypothetical protein